MYELPKLVVIAAELPELPRSYPHLERAKESISNIKAAIDVSQC